MYIEEDDDDDYLYDRLVDINELSKEVDEEFNNMSSEEKYKRLLYGEPTFLEWCCSIMSLNKSSKAIINEYTNKCEPI